MSTTVFDNAPPPAPRASISVIVLSHNSGRFIAEALGEQILFALQTFMRGSVVFTDEVLAEVRRHQTDATDNYGEIAVHELGGLKALAPQITRDIDLVAYRDRLVKAHVDAALYQTKQGRVRAGLRTLRDSFAVPGSSLRKLQGSARMVLALPQGMAK